MTASHRINSKVKSKLKLEGSEVSEKIGQLKMKSSDIKMRMTDIADKNKGFAKHNRREANNSKNIITSAYAHLLVNYYKGVNSLVG